MAKTSPNQAFPSVTRVRQRSDYHCGPAVVVMLASYIGRTIRQHDIVVAAHAKETYRTRGMTVNELGSGLLALHQDLAFWYKTDATIDDLDVIINSLGFPVGVEWQGAFGQYADEDNGHYSMVTAIHKNDNTIVLSDPFYYFAGTDRTFPIDEFYDRWWDINEVPDTPAASEKIEKDTRMIFLITKAGYKFQDSLSLRSANGQPATPA